MAVGILKIAGLELEPNLILAPMSGVTNSCYRRLIKSENPGAVGLVVTEFISIEGLTRQNLKSLQMMKFRPEERPISIQIFGHTVERMVEAAKMVEDAGADIIDINSGCPVPKVVRRGGGCELMRQPEHLEKLLRAVKSAISIPLTLKIRSGWDDSSRNAPIIAKVAEDAGVSMLAIHGRTRSQLYRGEADWDIVAEIAQSISIPVVGSGDVVDIDSAKRALAKGVAGLMIGRGSFLNPWIFSEILAGLSGKKFTRPADSRTVDIIEQYRDILAEELPEKAMIGKLKQLAAQVTRRVRGGAQYRKRLCLSNNVSQFSEVLVEFREAISLGKLHAVEHVAADNYPNVYSSEGLPPLGGC